MRDRLGVNLIYPTRRWEAEMTHCPEPVAKIDALSSLKDGVLADQSPRRSMLIDAPGGTEPREKRQSDSLLPDRRAIAKFLGLQGPQHSYETRGCRLQGGSRRCVGIVCSPGRILP